MVTISGGKGFDQAMRELARKLDKPATLNVGFLSGARYPNGTLVALVAVVQNFGSAVRGIPPRPFFSNMVVKRSPGWPLAFKECLKASNNDVVKSLNLMGEGIKGQLQQEIVDTNEPPLSPATIHRKGFEKPLVDTGHMMNSVDYEVKVDA